MSSIKNDIYTFLETLTDLQTLLGADKISTPDGELTMPDGIIYRMLSDPKINETNLKVAAQGKWQLWRFFINNQNKVTCQSIADEMELQMHQYSGTFGSLTAYMVWLDSNASPFRLDNLSTYQIIQDYRITILPS